jgi:cell fate regulator YaaT (PSP1 superfamily)
MSNQYDEQNNQENTAEKYPFSVAVCFRGAGKPYSFGSFNNNFMKDDWVVVETAQGDEMGQVVAEPLNVEKYGLPMPTKSILRKASDRDRQDYEENLEDEKEAFRICCDEIENLKLDMHLLSCQYTLAHDKILFIYIAEQRVDFRELLKRLGTALRCRIELRQIGERDKAKMVGGIGMCGMECCCTRFKNHFDVISINMAKNQLLALNIDKLSGMCGKLKCCLKYEDNDYKQLTEGLPKMGSQVEYDGEIYRITNMNVMSEEAKLENHQTAIFISLDDLRNKAIPRKGAVMKKRDPATDKPGHKTIIHTNRPSEEPKKEDRVLAAPTTSEARSFGHKDNNNQTRRDNQKQHENRNNRNNRNNNNQHRNNEARKPVQESKNVTVRSFGRKKDSGETK